MEIITKDPNILQLPNEADILPKNTPRHIHGASLSSAIIPAVVGATLIAFPAYFQQLPINHVPQSADVFTGVMFLMGMGLSTLALFKFKLHSETGGAVVDNPVYFERLYQILDKHNLETISLMACCEEYSNDTKKDIVYYLKRKQEKMPTTPSLKHSPKLFDSVVRDSEEIVVEENTQTICKHH